MQYITWVARNTTAWTVYADGVGADDTVEISARPIPQEPMVSPSPSPFSIFQSPTTATYAHTLFCMQYILANLGISTSFTTIDYDDLIFPAIMQLDYIRVRPTRGSFPPRLFNYCLCRFTSGQTRSILVVIRQISQRQIISARAFFVSSLSSLIV